jgi:hypothetical protein
VSAHFLYPTPVAERVDLFGKPTAALLRWDDAEGSAAWGFEHQCAFWTDEQEPDGVFIKVVAPRLTNHTVTRSDQGVTVRASILCPDCGVHGFVTNSTWEAA